MNVRLNVGRSIGYIISIVYSIERTSVQQSVWVIPKLTNKN